MSMSLWLLCGVDQLDMSRHPAGCSVGPNTFAKDDGVVIIDDKQGKIQEHRSVLVIIALNPLQDTE